MWSGRTPRLASLLDSQIGFCDIWGLGAWLSFPFGDAVFRLRPFRNSDPPGLVKIWRSQPPERGFFQPMSVMLLEHFVFSKPYFDRRGLILAERGGELVGFVHAGFGPNDDLSDLDVRNGVICMMQWASNGDDEQLRHELLVAAESYLRQRGAERIIAGPYPPFNPFYHGLIRTSELAGVLSQDRELHALYTQSGYEPQERFSLMDCSLAMLRPLVDRQQRELARAFEVRARLDHEFGNWWERCTFGPIQRSVFEVIAKIGLQRCGSFIWWNIDLEGAGLNPPTVSLTRLGINAEHRRMGLATFLMSHAMRQLKMNGTATIQLQVRQENEAGIRFFERMGFVHADEGISYCKSLA